ncbi:MAG: AI-2E family transporter [Terriglobales bacterium]
MTAKRSDAERAEELNGGVEEAPRAVPLPAQTEEQATEVQRHLRGSSTATTVLAIVAVLTVCYVAKLPIIVVLVSVLLAFILAPIVDLLQRIRIPRGLSALLAILLFLGVLWGIGQVSYYRAVAFSRELPKYSGRIRQVISKVTRQAHEFQKTTSQVLPEEQQEKQNAPTVTVQQQKGWGDVLTAGLGPTIEIVFMASFIPFLAFFMLSWQDHVRSASVMLFKMKNRNTAYVTLGLISGMIRSFIVGNVLVGLFMGALSTVVFGILGIPYFYFVGFISGFLSLIPYLGVLLAFLPPIIAGIGQIHSGGVIAIVATVLGLHLFALNVLYPKFLGSRLQLNPLAVTVSLLFWGWLWGAMGLVLAIPVTAAIKIVFDHVEPLRGYGAWLGE